MKSNVVVMEVNPVGFSTYFALQVSRAMVEVSKVHFGCNHDTKAK